MTVISKQVLGVYKGNFPCCTYRILGAGLTDFRGVKAKLLVIVNRGTAEESVLPSCVFLKNLAKLQMSIVHDCAT